MSTPTLWVTLQARDAGALIDWYVDAFGLVLTARHDLPDPHPASGGRGGRVAHAELATPDGPGGVMIGSFVEGAEWSVPPGTTNAYVVCADPDARYARAVAAGAEVLREPHDTDYGSREFGVRDPEGNSWSFGTYAGTGA